MRRTILQMAFPFARVGPDAVGGAEQILWQLDAALVEAGHRSLVIAVEGSRIAGELRPLALPAGLIDVAVRAQVHGQVRRAFEEVLRREPVDVIHLHGVDCHAYLPATVHPVLVTLHCPVGFYAPDLFQMSNIRFMCVSESQRSACAGQVPVSGVIANGVPECLTQVRHAKRGFAMAMGRICPEKNFHVALEAGHLARVPVLLAGETFPYPSHQSYFHEEIRPRLDRHRRFIGPIGPQRKRRLLAAASCLLMPSLAAETSSLVAMEALACGTPVIAFPSGALPEIIEHGRTGFLVRDTEEMASAIAACAALDPQACRETARQRFSSKRMCAEYLQLYEKTVAEVAHAR